MLKLKNDGGHISDVAHRAISLAKEKDEPVVFTFNGIDIIVYPTHERQVEEQYFAKHDSRRDEIKWAEDVTAVWLKLGETLNERPKGR